MNNTKMAGVFAAAGFGIAFVSGLFSGGGAGHVIGMAILFAVVFGALGFLIQWLGNGVLNVGEGEGDAIEDVPVPQRMPKTGGTIDVVVKDEELPSEENSPRFFVGNNHQMLDDSDYGLKPKEFDPLAPGAMPSPASAKHTQEANPVPPAPAAESSPLAAMPVAQSTPSAVPQQTSSSSAPPAVPSAASANGEEDKADSAPAAFEPISLGTEKLKSAPSAASASGGMDGADDELDEIPEFQGFATVEDDDSARNIAGDMIEDSDFASAGAPIRSKNTGAEMQDAALMAKAISTVLAKDK